MKISTKKMTLAGILSAITVVLSAVGVGFIPIPSLAGAATILHIPVIVAGALSGVLVGGFTGLIFGFFSFIQFGGTVGNNPIILFIPRILIGIFSALVFKALVKKNIYLASFVAGIVGTLTNTIGVLGLAVIFKYFTLEAALAITVSNLPLELALGAIISVGIIPPIYKVLVKKEIIEG